MRKYCYQNEQEWLNVCFTKTSRSPHRNSFSESVLLYNLGLVRLSWLSDGPSREWVSSPYLGASLWGILHSVSSWNFLSHSQLPGDLKMALLNTHNCLLFSLLFSYSSFGKYFEDVVSFLSQTYSELSLLTPWQPLFVNLSSFYLLCHWSDSIWANSSEEDSLSFIHFQKNEKTVCMGQQGSYSDDWFIKR